MKIDAAGKQGHAPHGVLEEMEHAVVNATHAILHTAELALRLPAPPASRWHRAGLSARSEKIFDIGAAVVLAVLATGWTWSVASASARGNVGDAVGSVTGTITAALTSADAAATPFLTEAALNAFAPLRGASGRLRAHIQEPGKPLPADSLPGGTRVEYSDGRHADTIRSDSAATPVAPPSPGVWRMAVRIGTALKPISDLNIITLEPFSAKKSGRIGLYYLGNWPYERGRGRTRARYAPPRGFIQVTPENRWTSVSEHFRLGDFLTKDQPNVWPKYLVLDTKLLDKLELVLEELQRAGIETRGVRVLSGFRTPQYNRGGGDPRGRAALSRHMYGDAADIYIDNDGNGGMDDLNRDGRVNVRDARVVEAAVDRVERRYPELVGGCGVYTAAPGHGPFVHIDTRGFRARWLGTGDS